MKYIIVQAGGIGSRLGHFTDNKPKALVPVGNKPILFHLFEMFPDKHFLIISDYKHDVMEKYLFCFADVSYQIIDSSGVGNCAGLRDALTCIPEKEAFMLIWSDLVLPKGFCLPPDYLGNSKPLNDYVGVSGDFRCRWSFRNGMFYEEPSHTHGVSGTFWFTNKEKLKCVPDYGEFARWLGESGLQMEPYPMNKTREFGVLEEVEQLPQPRCRPFNRLIISDNALVKQPISEQGVELAKKEQAWYQRLQKSEFDFLPSIFSFDPLVMEWINGKNLYEVEGSNDEKLTILEKVINDLNRIHSLDETDADRSSLDEAYYQKTEERLRKVQPLIPYADRPVITVNGKPCRNVFFHLKELRGKIAALQCDRFPLIHGDCTFSNIMLREDGRPVFLDPRGYFGHTALYGDQRYDWAKLYYSLIGNYDQFNLGRFRLNIGGNQGSRGTDLGK